MHRIPLFTKWSSRLARPVSFRNGLNGVQEVAGGDSHRAQDRAALGMQAPGGAGTANPAVPT
jgi:hypothetical protein